MPEDRRSGSVDDETETQRSPDPPLDAAAGDLDLDEALLVLASRPRRRLLVYLRSRSPRPVHLSEAVDALSDAGEETTRPDPGANPRSVRLSLLHRDIPRLTDGDVVRYDAETRVLTYVGDPTVEAFLEFFAERDLRTRSGKGCYPGPPYDRRMPTVPEEYHDLFEKPTFAHVTTLSSDGKPHATPVWVGYDDEDDRILVNTERERRKTRNVENDARVAISMTDPDNPYRFLSVTGEVETVTTAGAREHIDELTQRYMGEDTYPNPIESERVILRIRPDEVLSGG